MCRNRRTEKLIIIVHAEVKHGQENLVYSVCLSRKHRVAISINYSFGVAHVAEYVALFTSVSTAIYAILAQPKEKTEPLLRITPTLERHGAVFVGVLGSGESAGLNVWIENIGYSIAKDIETRCQLIPDASIPLKDNGVYKHSLLAPKKSPNIQLWKLLTLKDFFLSN